MAPVFGVTRAERDCPLRGKVISQVGEGRPSLRTDVAPSGRGQSRKNRAPSRVQTNVEYVECIGIEIIEAGNALDRALVGDELEFLAELAVAIDGRYVDVDNRRRIEVDRRETLVAAIGRN